MIPPEDYNISFQLMAVEGVLARRVADVRAAFTVMAGQHPRDPLSVPAVFTDLAPVFLDYALGYLPESDVAAWAMAHNARHGLARRWSLWYQEYPVLLSPVWSQPAFPLGFDIASLDNAIATLELMRPALPANLLGTPAAVVPAGMADGLPVGVQVVGGKYTELRCLGRRRGDRAATRNPDPDRPGRRLSCRVSYAPFLSAATASG